MARYEVVKCLGAGNFGRVDLVKDNTGRQYALKSIDKTTATYRASHVQQEVRAGELLKCTGVARMFNYWESATHVFLLMEYIQGSDMITYMEKKNFEPFNEITARKYFTQIITTLNQCHTKGIAHRDLKLDNLIIDHNEDIKVIDFGLCKTSDTSNCRDAVGSIEYCAPEIVKRRPYDAFLSDVYSAGVLLFAFLYGEFPFSIDKIKAHAQRGAPLQLKFLDDKVTISEEAKDLLQKMMNIDPSQRISMKRVLQHPWFSAPIATPADF
eukprot:TRINITY_DN10174_c0_g1_i1.p1 TRINITY_DN10174_c0_g1~~TRINITY_DN10174_c0_g1_i1.p1  ORF type:complete len:268 (+),score=90.30 TRINITY_DN10174_c0_g1_i1:82-885(+)